MQSASMLKFLTVYRYTDVLQPDIIRRLFAHLTVTSFFLCIWDEVDCTFVEHL